jgi:hypothetical protein
MDTAIFNSTQSPFVKRSQRYDLRNMMDAESALPNSPGFQSSQYRLNADTLTHLPKGLNHEMTPDARSMRSKRSLSINVNKISKIIKVNDDGVSSISKVKDPAFTVLRHTST